MAVSSICTAASSASDHPSGVKDLGAAILNRATWAAEPTSRGPIKATDPYRRSCKKERFYDIQWFWRSMKKSPYRHSSEQQTLLITQHTNLQRKICMPGRTSKSLTSEENFLYNPVDIFTTFILSHLNHIKYHRSKQFFCGCVSTYSTSNTRWRALAQHYTATRRTAHPPSLFFEQRAASRHWNLQPTSTASFLTAFQLNSFILAHFGSTSILTGLPNFRGKKSSRKTSHLW